VAATYGHVSASALTPHPTGIGVDLAQIEAASTRCAATSNQCSSDGPRHSGRKAAIVDSDNGSIDTSTAPGRVSGEKNGAPSPVSVQLVVISKAVCRYLRQVRRSRILPSPCPPELLTCKER